MGYDELLYSTHGRVDLVMLLVAACEMGDSEVVDALSSYLDGKYEAGASAAVKIARRRGLWRDLITQGMPEAWVRGPRLTDVAYPDVLVARAVTDGEALDLDCAPARDPSESRSGSNACVPPARGRHRRGITSAGGRFTGSCKRDDTAGTTESRSESLRTGQDGNVP